MGIDRDLSVRSTFGIKDNNANVASFSVGRLLDDRSLVQSARASPTHTHTHSYTITMNLHYNDR